MSIVRVRWQLQRNSREGDRFGVAAEDDASVCCREYQGAFSNTGRLAGPLRTGKRRSYRF